jgi:Mn-dependent DtxR family transcriptional regulator
MEDYLEVIYELIELKGYASPTSISQYMNVRPSSVTSMLQRLAKNNYIEYTKYQGVKLNSNGEKIAKEIHQKHSQYCKFSIKTNSQIDN